MNKFGKILPTSIAPNILPGVTPQDLKEVRCKNCQGQVFHPVALLKFASRFQTKSGSPTMVRFPIGFACSTCNQINPFEDMCFQDGQKKETKEENTSGDLGISVGDGIATKDKLV